MFLSIFGILLATYFTYLFHRLVIKPRSFWQNKNVKQLPFVPIFGNNWRILFRTTSFSSFVENVYKRFPNERYIGMFQFTLPTLVLRDPDLIKQIAVKDFDHFLDHRSFAGPSDEVWNKNLFSLKGQEWRDMRATLSPTFTTSKMRAMFTLMKQSGQQYVDFYLKQNKNFIEMEVKDSYTRFTNDVIANCAFGVACDSLNEPNNEFYLNGKELSDFSGVRKMLRFVFAAFFPRIAKLFNISVFSQRIGNYFKKLIVDSVNHREQNHIVRPDMINLMMEAKKGQLKYEEDAQNSKSAGFATVEESHVGRAQTQKLSQITEVDMAAQCMIFFLAGFDTVSTVMTFMSYALATNPDIQEKLREEVDETFEATKGNLTYDTLAGMKYMDMVITETLRMYPPVFAVDRVCTKPYVIQPGNVNLDVDDIVWLPIYSIHHCLEFYPEPEQFIPERFSDENKASIKPYTFLPFGVGPRNCIGSRFALMEIKTLFYNILRNFEIVPTKKTPVPIVFKKGVFTPMIEGGCWVALQKRDN